MLNRSLSLALMAVLLGSGAFAQSFMDRAAAAADGSVNTGSTFRDETVNEVVTPFQTSRPPEAGMRHTTFEDRILETRDADKTQGRVLRATEDSALIRPDIDIDGQGELFDDANWAHENAEDIAGRYFSSETGSCTTPEVPESDVRDEFCESLPAREEKTCRLIRKIWVDRTDTYRCDRRASNFVQVCEKNNVYECKVNTNQAACIQRMVRFAGADEVTWSGKRATVKFSAQRVNSGTDVSYRNVSALKKFPFSVRIADRLAVSSAMIRHVQASGILQITTGDGSEVAGSFADAVGGNFGGGSGNCPANDRDGLLVPLDQVQGCNHQFNPIPLAAITKRALSSQSNYRDVVAGSPSMEDGWDVSEGLSSWKQGRWHWVKVCERGCNNNNYRMECRRAPTDSCFTYVNLNTDRSIDRDVLRFLNLRTYDRARPDAGRRFRSTNFVARLVYRPEVSDPAAEITFEFEGNCCDSFRNVGTEVCE